MKIEQPLRRLSLSVLILASLLGSGAGPTGPVQVIPSGRAVVEHDVPVTAETRFRLASTSKAVTAVALAALADRGVVELDEPVGTYLPELPVHLRDITPRQLAGHLGGIRHYGPEAHALDLRRWPSARAALEIFAGDPLRADPGREYHYSTFGYTLLAATMEPAAGMPFEQVVRKEVAGPLGLESLAADDPREVIPHHTGHYERSDDGSLRRAPFVDPSYKLAGGGLLASAEDLARLGRALVAGEILSERSRRALFRSQRTLSGEETGVGLGWRVGTDPLGREVWHHKGSMSGARSAILLYPEAGVTVVVLSNLSATPYFVFETAAALFGIHLAPADRGCFADLIGEHAGTAELNRAPTALRLDLEEGSAGPRGTLHLGTIPLPVDSTAPVVAGWCRAGDPVLVIAFGPRLGFLPVTLAPGADGWRGSLELDGGHSLALTLRR